MYSLDLSIDWLSFPLVTLGWYFCHNFCYFKYETNRRMSEKLACICRYMLIHMIKPVITTDGHNIHIIKKYCQAADSIQKYPASSSVSHSNIYLLALTNFCWGFFYITVSKLRAATVTLTLVNGPNVRRTKEMDVNLITSG